LESNEKQKASLFGWFFYFGKKMIKTLAIVPARGGSKRLPGKNTKRLDGKPLIFHTIDKAIKHFDKVIFSSDDDKMINKVKINYFVDHYMSKKLEIDKRPKSLSSDTSKVIDTVCYYFDNKKYESYQQIWLMLPTCPLRGNEDILNAKELLTKKVDSVISITDYGFPPTLGLSLNDDGTIIDWHESRPWKNNNTRSQDHPRVYRPNGAIYGSWRKSFSGNRNFYFGKVIGSYMPRSRSVDIDTELDFLIAESVIKNNRYNRTKKTWPWIQMEF
jgi:CMP-N-acetylneuraminic acid synthetase